MSLKPLFVQPHAKYPGVREIILNRVEKRNALTFDMWRSLIEAIETCSTDPQVRVVVLRGIDHTAFAAGADISEFPVARHDRASFLSYQSVTDEATRNLHEMRPLTIAAIQGLCYGGGVQIASACDIRICDTTARFAITPAKLGFVYGLYETRLLVNLVGVARAKDLLYSARELSAHEAYTAGLVTQMAEPANYHMELNGYLERLLSVSSIAQSGTKQIIQRITEGQVDEDDFTTELVLDSIERADYQEGIHAFLGKRQPRF